MAGRLRDTPRSQDTPARDHGDEKQYAFHLVNKAPDPPQEPERSRLPSTRRFPDRPSRGEEIAIATAEISHAVYRQRFQHRDVSQHHRADDSEQNRQDAGNKL